MQPKVLDPITLFHDPRLASSSRALSILKQAALTAEEAGLKGRNTRGEFDLQVTTESPTTGQLENILEYISGSGGAYTPSEVVVGAKDTADALKKFRADQGTFIRPVVCSSPAPLLSPFWLAVVLIDFFPYRLSTGPVVKLFLVTMSRRF